MIIFALQRPYNSYHFQWMFSTNRGHVICVPRSMRTRFTKKQPPPTTSSCLSCLTRPRTRTLWPPCQIRWRCFRNVCSSSMPCLWTPKMPSVVGQALEVDLPGRAVPTAGIYHVVFLHLQVVPAQKSVFASIGVLDHQRAFRNLARYFDGHLLHHERHPAGAVDLQA